MAAAALDDLLARPRRLVEPDAGAAVAFEHLLDADEDFRPHRLRAGITAPQPPRQRCEEEQRQARDDQQQCQEDEILRPEGQAEHVELARRQIEQHGLVAIPVQPGEQVIHAQQHDGRQLAQALRDAIDLAWMDLRLGDVERAAGINGGGNLFFHCRIGARFRAAIPCGRISLRAAEAR